MNLIVKCKHCRAENKAPHQASSRINYLKKHGEAFNLKCCECNETNDYEVDDIRAVEYGLRELLLNRIVVLLIIMVTTFFLSFFLISETGAIMISVISLMIFALIAKKNDAKAILTFNKHKVKGRMTNIGQ